jgi:hypothetical protein
MKMRKLSCLISLAILGCVVQVVGSHLPATSTQPVLKADGGAPVPPPIPIPPTASTQPVLKADGGAPVPPPIPVPWKPKLS